MRSWIGLYALLWMIRDAGMTDFTREGITQMLNQAQDVPMLDMFGGENWTPDADHPGVFAGPASTTGRRGTGIPRPRPRTASRATSSRASEIIFDDVLCGSPFGAPTC